MEILWWLAPPAAVTAIAMVWVSWLGRAGRGEIDRDEAVRRIGVALERPEPRKKMSSVQSRLERSSGVAVRRSRAVSDN